DIIQHATEIVGRLLNHPAPEAECQRDGSGRGLKIHTISRYETSDLSGTNGDVQDQSAEKRRHWRWGIAMERDLARERAPALMFGARNCPRKNRGIHNPRRLGNYALRGGREGR